MIHSSKAIQLTERLLRSYQGSPDAVLQSGRRPIPSLLEVRDMVEDLRELLFPGLTDGRESAPADVSARVNVQISHLAVRLARQISLARRCSCEGSDASRSDAAAWSERAAWALLDALPTVRGALLEDAGAALAGDPAAHSVAEVVLCYPGYYAITVHRLAHVLLRFGVPLLPRMMAEHAHRATGVDIHPPLGVVDYSIRLRGNPG
ncbi:MAG: hypothetical protein JW940_06265 [Polyangiaceae bacterium]|nr:hypothetical protein [Polyangiaceae bacterium]